jgi:hypothetical protein
MQGSSAIVTIAHWAGGQTRIRVIGRYGYVKTDWGHNADRWLRSPSQQFKAIHHRPVRPLNDDYGPLEPKVQQATVNARKVVVVSWRNGSKLYAANTGPAYPLRADFKGQHYPVRMVFSEYDVPLDIAAPSNAIDASKAG